MDLSFINYLVISMIISLGFVGGYLVGKIAEEELKNGEKYFKEAGKFILLLIFLVFTYSLNQYKLLQIILFLTIIMGFIFTKIRRIHLLMPEIKWVYLILGILFYLGQNKLLLGSLILIYGFPVGSLFYLKKKNSWNLILPISLFLIITNMLYLIF